MDAGAARHLRPEPTPWVWLPTGPPLLRRPGCFDLRVAGTFYYQAAFHDLYGPRDPRGVRVEDDGELVTEEGNPFDANAIALIVGGQMLGHLPRHHAAQFRETLADQGIVRGRFPVRLLVTGGVSTSEGRLAQFLAHLDLQEPLGLA